MKSLRSNASEIVPEGRILLVEDEMTNMAILSAYLRMAGYQVVEAGDGKEAWDFLTTKDGIDLVVTDRRMPNMDGLELAMRINKDAKFKSIPIIMQTSAASQEEIRAGVRAGVFYYLAKPYEEATLLGIVRSAILEKQRNDQFQFSLDRQKEAFETFVKGEFHVRSPLQAKNVALLIGDLFPRPELAVTGLYEIILNGIEHGNLGIGYEAKGALLADRMMDAEITRRLDLPENRNKKVVVQCAGEPAEITVVITDDGQGFDPRPYMEIEPSRATRQNGRGIAKANLLSFDRLEYAGRGNSVSVSSSR